MKSKQSGSTVILSMIVIIVLAVCVGGALDYTLQMFRSAQDSNARDQAISAATGALDLAYVQWRQACRLNGNIVLTPTAITSNTLSGWSTPTYTALTGTGASTGSHMNISGLANPITITLSPLDATNPNTTNSPLSSGTIPVPSQAQSVNMPTYNYLAKATASYQTIKGTKTVNVCRIFQKATETPWQYAIFYNNDLEINPGAAMNITGVVKTNANLYTGGSDGTNYLNFSSQTYYATSWNSNGSFSPTDTANAGETAKPPTGVAPTQQAAQSPANANILGTTNTTPGAQDGYHELIEPPPSGNTNPLAGTSTTPSPRLYNQAGIKIILTGTSRTNPTVTIYDGSGNACTSTSAKGSDDLAIYNAINGAYTTNQTLYDGREGTTMDLTTIDVSKLTSALNGSLVGVQSSNSSVENNVVYIADETTQASHGNCAIELINGYAMPSGGLTVVSENPVYVVGDYNTSTSQSDIANVPSNYTSGNNPLQPWASDYTQQPAAIMADAVTILSNAWQNSDGGYSLTSSQRKASNTTVNAALLSGIVTSGNGFVYTGGVENYPRFLENWSGYTFTYYGSMVELFNSMQGTGVYQEPGAYYNPPVRHWYFNVLYYTDPPPGTFVVINYVKGRYFIQ